MSAFVFLSKLYFLALTARALTSREARDLRPNPSYPKALTPGPSPAAAGGGRK